MAWTWKVLDGGRLVVQHRIDEVPESVGMCHGVMEGGECSAVIKGERML